MRIVCHYQFSRWRPRWPPKHRNMHISAHSYATMTNKPSTFIVPGSRNQFIVVRIVCQYHFPRWRPSLRGKLVLADYSQYDKWIPWPRNYESGGLVCHCSLHVPMFWYMHISVFGGHLGRHLGKWYWQTILTTINGFLDLRTMELEGSFIIVAYLWAEICIFLWFAGYLGRHLRN